MGNYMRLTCRSVANPAIALLIATTIAASAAEDIRLLPQLALGTSGIEPGVAVELRDTAVNRLIVRPEILINEDERIGGGLAVLYDISDRLPDMDRRSLAIGPRLVHHNSDETGWEADVMVTFGMQITDRIDAWKHSVGILGALGVRDDREDDNRRIGATLGGWYAYRL